MSNRRPPCDKGRGGPPRGRPAAAAPTSWDPLATWYDGWVGEGGSEYHRHVAVPAVLKLLQLQRGEHVLDVGAGQGVLAAPVAQAAAKYTGVDASPRLIALARQRHGREGEFVVGDARRLFAVPGVEEHRYDAVTFLLSLQDMDPLDPVVANASRALKPGGRLVVLLTHPAFRVPRQSGWGWDDGRKLVYRRVDRYLTPLPVPMKALPGKDNAATTRSFHRPISEYVNSMAANGLLIDHMDEIPAHKLQGAGQSMKAEDAARREIPLFLALRARTRQSPS